MNHNEDLARWVTLLDMEIHMRYERYKAYRAKYNTSAMQACRQAKAKPQPKFIHKLPYVDGMEYVNVPGLGSLKFELISDTDHDPYDGDGQAFQWVNMSERGFKQRFPAGATVMDNCYSLDHWDGRGLYCIRFDRKSGGRLEDHKKYYQSNGMSKSDAEVKARNQIQSECQYWHKVAKGDISWVGARVLLRDDNDAELDIDEVWGYEYPDPDDYLLSEMNSWAVSLVAKHWQKKHGCEAPMPGNPIVDAALKAWHTAMVTSDSDSSIADPVFVSTYKDYLYAERLRTDRPFQLRSRTG